MERWYHFCWSISRRRIWWNWLDDVYFFIYIFSFIYLLCKGGGGSKLGRVGGGLFFREELVMGDHSLNSSLNVSVRPLHTTFSFVCLFGGGGLFFLFHVFSFLFFNLVYTGGK